MKTYFSAILLLAVGMIIGACSSPDENDEAQIPTQIAQTIEAKLVATAAIERALAEVLTGTASVPTITPTLTLTPTPTETLTPTPPPMATVIRENAPVFAGPGTLYDLIVELSFGDQVEILGKSENEGWLWVQLADNTQGWIATELVDLQGKITQFIVVHAPPTPTTPPAIYIIIVNEYTGVSSVYTLNFQIVDLGLSYSLKSGQSLTIKVAGGYHYIVVDVAHLYCEKQVYFRNDIYLVVSPYVDACAPFR